MLGGIQIFLVNPVIYSAEVYETEEAFTLALSDQYDHEHSHRQWAPEHGLERKQFTLVSSIFAGIGFAAVMLAIMNQIQLSLNRSFNWLKGVLWGLAGFLSVFVAPAIGVPPEIPGMQTALIEHRQICWVLTVFSVAIGLALIAFTPLKLKAVGLLFLALPYLFIVPKFEGALFQHEDPAVVKALQLIHIQFVTYSGIANLIFWVAMGVACALTLKRQQV